MNIDAAALATRVLSLRSQLDEVLDEIAAVEVFTGDSPIAAIFSQISHAREFAANAGWALDDLAEGRKVFLETLPPHPNVLGPGLA